MASINWAMISSTGQPLPLPNEKFLLSLAGVSLSLFSHPPGAPLNVQPASKHDEYKCTAGTVHLSNKRIIYVAPSATGRPEAPAGGATSGVSASASTGAGGSLANGQASIAPGGVPREGAAKNVPLQTLSIPWSHFQDGRFKQPYFTAAYYEALCLPQDGGGLSSPHLLRLYFKESGGYDFYQTVEEMKARLAESSGRRGTPAVEALPLYTPAAPHASSPLAQDGASAASLPSPASTFLSPTPAHPPPRTMPSSSDLAAASVAREAEDLERREREHIAQEEPAPPPIGDDAPPGYDA
ncbi:hypothetical protein JCM21900_005626 [Sporobolomyces salmonicolor]